MKKILLVTSFFLFIICIAAIPKYTYLVEMVIINKSGYDIEISLSGNETEEQYYFRIPVGSEDEPTEKTFEVIPDTYTASLYYVELWDPVYGYTCDDKSHSINANHKTRIIVYDCLKSIRKPGEYPIIKFGVSGRLGHGGHRK